MARTSKSVDRDSAKKRQSSSGNTGKGSGRKPNPALMKPVQPSEELAEIVGMQPLPRSELTRKLWAYIKENALQDQDNKRMIKADARLKPVFGGRAEVNMFEMTKLVNKHVS